MKDVCLIERPRSHQLFCVSDRPMFAGEMVAVFASHLYPLAIRAHKVGLHVQIVVQPKLARVGQLLRRRREIWMCPVEACDRFSEMRFPVPCAQIFMALRAARS